MTDPVLSALIAESESILKDVADARKENRGTVVHIDQVEKWHKRASSFIAGRSPELSAQVPVLDVCDEYDEISVKIATTESILKSLRGADGLRLRQSKNDERPEKNETTKSHKIQILLGVLSFIGAIGAAVISTVDFGSDDNLDPKNEAIEISAPAPETRSSKCRHPSHGIEAWQDSEGWSADSGWRGGGSSPSEFCGAKKLQRESQFPNRNVILLAPAENHRVKHDPFKRDEYRYTCTFEDKWGPIYKLAHSEYCK